MPGFVNFFSSQGRRHDHRARDDRSSNGSRNLSEVGGRPLQPLTAYSSTAVGSGAVNVRAGSRAVGPYRGNSSTAAATANQGRRRDGSEDTPTLDNLLREYQENVELAKDSSVGPQRGAPVMVLREYQDRGSGSTSIPTSNSTMSDTQTPSATDSEHTLEAEEDDVPAAVHDLSFDGPLHSEQETLPNSLYHPPRGGDNGASLLASARANGGGGGGGGTSWMPRSWRRERSSSQRRQILAPKARRGRDSTVASPTTGEDADASSSSDGSDRGDSETAVAGARIVRVNLSRVGHPPQRNAVSEVEVVRLAEEFYASEEIARWQELQATHIDSSLMSAPRTATLSSSHRTHHSSSTNGSEFVILASTDDESVVPDGTQGCAVVVEEAPAAVTVVDLAIPPGIPRPGRLAVGAVSPAMVSGDVRIHRLSERGV